MPGKLAKSLTPRQIDLRPNQAKNTGEIRPRHMCQIRPQLRAKYGQTHGPDQAKNTSEIRPRHMGQIRTKSWAKPGNNYGLNQAKHIGQIMPKTRAKSGQTYEPIKAKITCQIKHAYGQIRSKHGPD